MQARSRLGRALVIAVAAAAVTLVGPAPPVGAATITVTTTADGGAGSLRDAFAQASVAVEPTTIVLAEDESYVLDDCGAGAGDLAHTGTQPLEIRGNGSTIQQTCAGERVIATDGDIVVLDTTITGGRLVAGIGGGIEADTADVVLVRSIVTDNQAPIGAGAAAIRVELVQSTVHGNSGSIGAGVWADQLATIVNSTITGNEATTSGGGITVVNDTVLLTHATVAANAAPVGANIELQQGSDSLTTFASVIADPEGGGSDCAIDAGAATDSKGYNAATDSSCGLGGAPGDVDGGFAVDLGPLSDNGGSTPTMEPEPGSFLIDLVECGYGGLPVTTDQRGVVRAQGIACDVGAVEVVQEVVPPSTGPPPPTGPTPPTGPPPPAAPPAVPVPGPATFTG